MEKTGILYTDLSREMLREVLDYNPMSGVFSLRVNGKKLRAGHEFLKVNRYGYVWVTVPGLGLSAKKMAHRLAFLYMLGYIPPAIDHINHNKADNRWINLRPVTPIQNGRNRKLHKNSKSGMDGVQWYESRGRWVVYVCGKYGGQFSELEDAKKRAYELRKGFGYFTDEGP